MTSITSAPASPTTAPITLEQFENGFDVAFHSVLEPAQSRVNKAFDTISHMTPQQKYDGVLLKRLVNDTKLTSRDVYNLRDLLVGRDRINIWNTVTLLANTHLQATETIKKIQINEALEFLQDESSDQLFSTGVGQDFVTNKTHLLEDLENSNTELTLKLAPLFAADKELDDLHALKAQLEKKKKDVELEIWKLDREKAQLIRETKAKFPNENNPIHHAGIDAMKPTFAAYTKRREAFMANRETFLTQLKDVATKIKAHEDYIDGKTTVAPVAASVAANSNNATTSAAAAPAAATN